MIDDCGTAIFYVCPMQEGHTIVGIFTVMDKNGKQVVISGQTRGGGRDIREKIFSIPSHPHNHYQQPQFWDL